MSEIWPLILIHQIIFQGMFVTKNILLSKKLKQTIRGKNIEATISIIYFSFIIATALIFSYFNITFGEINLLNEPLAIITGLLLLSLNLIISGASLIHLGDSWRVGVLENQKTDFVTSGIYRYTRNPYFLSYILMFISYVILLQNLVLLGLTIPAIFFVHKMILKEEEYLQSKHSDTFLQYKQKVPRYILI